MTQTRMAPERRLVQAAFRAKAEVLMLAHEAIEIAKHLRRRLIDPMIQDWKEAPRWFKIGVLGLAVWGSAAIGIVSMRSSLFFSRRSINLQEPLYVVFSPR